MLLAAKPYPGTLRAGFRISESPASLPTRAPMCFLLPELRAMRRALLVAVLLLPPLCPALAADPKPDAKQLPPASAKTIDFTRDVRPILARSCLGCHGVEKQRGGLRLDSAAEAHKGGNTGPVLKPGDATAS